MPKTTKRPARRPATGRAAAGRPAPAAAAAAAEPTEAGRQTEADERLWTWVGAAAILVGAALRLSDLGGKSLWFDEALSIDDSRSLEQRFGSGFHPPLYYWLLHAWMAAFGESAAAVRLTAALPGAATVGVVFLLARRCFSARAGAFAASVLALSSLHLEYSQEARMYALATMLAAVAALVAAEAVARERGASRARAWAWAAATAAAALAAAATHYLALFVLAALGVALAVGWPATRPLLARLALLAAPAALAALAALAATGYIRQVRVAAEFFSTGRGVNQRLFVDAGARLARLPLDFALEILPGTSLKWLVVADYRWAAVAVFDLAALWAVVALARSRAPRWARALALVTALLPIPVVALMLGPEQLRFFVVVAPFVAVALGAGLAAARPRAAAAAALAAVLAASALACWWYYDPGMDKQPWRRVGEIVSAEARPGDIVLVNEPHLMIAFERYFERPPGVELEGYPEVGGIRIAEGDLDRWLLPLVRSRERVWFVRMAATASQSDPQGLGLRWLAANRRLVTRLREPGYNGDVEIFLFER